jgi:hypothetical protein
MVVFRICCEVSSVNDNETRQYALLTRLVDELCDAGGGEFDALLNLRKDVRTFGNHGDTGIFLNAMQQRF